MDVEDDPDNNDGSFFPCEFCGDPYPCEFLMRHQISCDLNPQPVASGQGFDYSAIKRNIGDHLGVPESSYGRRKVSTATADTAEKSAGRPGECPAATPWWIAATVAQPSEPPVSPEPPPSLTGATGPGPTWLVSPPSPCLTTAMRPGVVPSLTEWRATP